MQSYIHPSFYTSTDIFKQEQTHIFHHLWQFVGFTLDLKNHNDYICAEVGGKSVIVQNFHGELKAFHNVCSHRLSRIRQFSHGNEPLKCPYHGWVYDSDGIPVAIPCKSEFTNLDDSAVQLLRLEQWLVEICGSLVFVKRYDDQKTLKEYLQEEIFNTLESISKALGQKNGCYEATIKANWKVVVENSLEDYHVKQIHPQSLGRVLIPECNYSFLNLHSLGTLVPKTQSKKMEKLESIFSNRPYKLDKYYHYLLFPNLMLATTQGLSFSIQSVYATSPSETKFKSYLFLSKLDNNTNEISSSQQAIVEVLSKSILEFNNKVLSEDWVICEQNQLGISESEKYGILSMREKRIQEFQKAYISVMNKKLD
ncbi:MAG: aromatic ring-hydroxylating dioxygenase subunit alpha [Nostoc sp.]|uniref:aromatic ring-hydroxylating oxygenase subunit alpha n=1 Tax=Nostoc sp. TaxID=1180 RepID=UPI002FFD1361